MLKNAFSLMQPFVSLIKHWIMQRNFLVNMFSLRPRLLTFYILAITARTTSFKKTKILHSARSIYVFFVWISEHRILAHIAFSNWFYRRDGKCLLWGTNSVFK
jgi:hypothetical protein